MKTNQDGVFEGFLSQSIRVLKQKFAPLREEPRLKVTRLDEEYEVEYTGNALVSQGMLDALRMTTVNTARYRMDHYVVSFRGGVEIASQVVCTYIIASTGAFSPDSGEQFGILSE